MTDDFDAPHAAVTPADAAIEAGADPDADLWVPHAAFMDAMRALDDETLLDVFALSFTRESLRKFEDALRKTSATNLASPLADGRVALYFGYDNANGSAILTVPTPHVLRLSEENGRITPMVQTLQGSDTDLFWASPAFLTPYVADDFKSGRRTIESVRAELEGRAAVALMLTT